MRGGQNPLAGALITSCTQVGTNGYRLIYTLSGASDTVDYSWTTSGIYTFTFRSPGVPPRDSIYTGFIPCYVLPTETQELSLSSNLFDIVPNPTNGVFQIALKSPLNANSIKRISVYNMVGQLVYEVKSYSQMIDARQWPKGNYLINLQYSGEQVNRILVIQ